MTDLFIYCHCLLVVLASSLGLVHARARPHTHTPWYPTYHVASLSFRFAALLLEMIQTGVTASSLTVRPPPFFFKPINSAANYFQRGHLFSSVFVFLFLIFLLRSNAAASRFQSLNDFLVFYAEHRFVCNSCPDFNL